MIQKVNNWPSTIVMTVKHWLTGLKQTPNASIPSLENHLALSFLRKMAGLTTTLRLREEDDERKPNVRPLAEKPSQKEKPKVIKEKKGTQLTKLHSVAEKETINQTRYIFMYATIIATNAAPVYAPPK